MLQNQDIKLYRNEEEFQGTQRGFVIYKKEMT